MVRLDAEERDRLNELIRKGKPSAQLLTKIAQACEERVDFIAVTAMNRPDHRTIARFRRRHLEALGDLFVQVLKL